VSTNRQGKTEVKWEGFVSGNFFINIYQFQGGWTWTIRNKNHMTNHVLYNGAKKDLRKTKIEAAKWGFINLFLLLNKDFVKRSRGEYARYASSYYIVRGE
jgi:hypothetical protein